MIKSVLAIVQGMVVCFALMVVVVAIGSGFVWLISLL